MPSSSLTPLLRHVRRAAFRADAGELSDGQLLERFLTLREEAAFESLVRRHGAMVLGVCRRVLHNRQDAEDAFQATFLVLVRKANSIVPRELVGNWLYGVAYRTALKARGMAARRRAMERQVRDMPHPPTLDPGARDDLLDRLDGALHRLPDKYRAPVLLCELEGKSRRDAARQLGIAEGTLSSRLARARQMLARRLSGRNAALSAAAVGTLISTQAASATVPAPLLASTVKAGALLAVGQAVSAVVSANVAALTQGVLKAMLLTKLKTMLACVAVAGVLALAVGALGPTSQADPGPTVAATDPPVPEQKKSKSDKDESKQKIETKKITTPDSQSKVEEAVAKSFKTKGTPRLIVETFNGAIEVTAHPKGAVNAKVTKTVRAASEDAAKEDLKNVDVQMSQEADTIRIIAKSVGEHPLTNRAAAVEVQVPPGSTLDLHTSNGKVAINAPVGNANVQTSNGSITVAGGKGEMKLKTNNGSITAEGAAGTLDLLTSNGRIAVKTSKSSVTAHTSNGSIHFNGALIDGEHKFHTTNGSIELTLPADARFRVDAQTSHGHATSKFQIKDGAKEKRNRLQGAVGENPATAIHLRTTNGNIEIRPDK